MKHFIMLFYVALLTHAPPTGCSMENPLCFRGKKDWPATPRSAPGLFVSERHRRFSGVSKSSRLTEISWDGATTEPLLSLNKERVANSARCGDSFFVKLLNKTSSLGLSSQNKKYVTTFNLHKAVSALSRAVTALQMMAHSVEREDNAKFLLAGGGGGKKTTPTKPAEVTSFEEESLYSTESIGSSSYILHVTTEPTMTCHKSSAIPKAMTSLQMIAHPIGHEGNPKIFLAGGRKKLPTMKPGNKISVAGKCLYKTTICGNTCHFPYVTTDTTTPYCRTTFSTCKSCSSSLCGIALDTEESTEETDESEEEQTYISDEVNAIPCQDEETKSSTPSALAVLSAILVDPSYCQNHLTRSPAKCVASSATTTSGPSCSKKPNTDKTSATTKTSRPPFCCTPTTKPTPAKMPSECIVTFHYHKVGTAEKATPNNLCTTTPLPPCGHTKPKCTMTKKPITIQACKGRTPFSTSTRALERKQDKVATVINLAIPVRILPHGAFMRPKSKSRSDDHVTPEEQRLACSKLSPETATKKCSMLGASSLPSADAHKAPNKSASVIIHMKLNGTDISPSLIDPVIVEDVEPDDPYNKLKGDGSYDAMKSSYVPNGGGGSTFRTDTSEAANSHPHSSDLVTTRQGGVSCTKVHLPILGTVNPGILQASYKPESLTSY